jgi:hypothetical protein
MNFVPNHLKIKDAKSLCVGALCKHVTMSKYTADSASRNHDFEVGMISSEGSVMFGISPRSQTQSLSSREFINGFIPLRSPHTKHLVQLAAMMSYSHLAEGMSQDIHNLLVELEI